MNIKFLRGPNPPVHIYSHIHRWSYATKPGADRLQISNIDIFREFQLDIFKQITSEIENERPLTKIKTCNGNKVF